MHSGIEWAFVALGSIKDESTSEHLLCEAKYCACPFFCPFFCFFCACPFFCYCPFFGAVSGGFSFGHIFSIGFSPGKNSRGKYTHTRTVFGAGANVMGGGSGIAVSANVSGGISDAYYFPIGEPF